MAEGGMVVGLDLGTTKICAVIAERMPQGSLHIVGVGNSPSDGLRRGVVVDVEKTVAAIEKAVEEAELMAGVEVDSVYAGIAGEHIDNVTSRGVVAVGGADREISPADRDRVIEIARAVAAIPGDREILHVLHQGFAVDDQRGISDPVGMSGARLEADVHIVTGAVTSAQNICKSILRAGIEVRELVLEPLAASYAVLEEDEKQMGVCLVDLGGGTANTAVFCQGSLRHTGIIGLGGQNVTNDLAIGLRTSWLHAEEAKTSHGTALASRPDPDDTVEVPGVTGRPARPVSRRLLGAIIEPRMEEILTMVRREIDRSHCGELLRAGAVLTGGGALLDGVVELAESILELPVRPGVPRGFGGMAEQVTSPIYTTALGLVLFGAENGESTDGRHKADRRGERRLDRVYARMKEWVQAVV